MGSAPVNGLSNGDYWIVKSADVWIQGRYKATEWTDGLAATHTIAIGGPFMGNHKFIVEPKTVVEPKTGATHGGVIRYDNRVVLNTINSNFRSSVLTANYHNQGVSLDSGIKEDVAIVDIDLPRGIKVTINRWQRHIDAKILMAAEPGQDGHCGNYNGVVADDTAGAIAGRVPTLVSTQPEYLLDKPTADEFDFDPSVKVKTCVGPHKVASCSTGVGNCEQAKQLCQQADRNLVDGSPLLETCMYDVCFQGKQFASEDGADFLVAPR